MGGGGGLVINLSVVAEIILYDRITINELLFSFYLFCEEHNGLSSFTLV